MLVEMKKLVLIAHSARRNRILRALHRSKLVEVSATQEIENTETYENVTREEELGNKIARVASVLQFLKTQKKEGLIIAKQTAKEAQESKFDYKPIKVSAFQNITRISYGEFTNIPATEVELLAHVAEIEKIQNRYTVINSDILKARSLIEQLEIYSSIENKFSLFTDTVYTNITLGYVPFQQKENVEEIATQFPNAHFEFYEAGVRFVPFTVVSLKEESDQIIASLQNLEFVECNYQFDGNAKEIIENEKENIATLENEKVGLLRKVLAKESYIADWKQLYDYYLIEIAKQSAAANTRCTKSVFVLEGWFPAGEEARLSAIFDDCCSEIIYEFREPEKDEIVPTLVKSGKLIDPYQDVTNMFSTPNYRGDFDPNPIMAFFFFLFFGMMLADAGYGLLLAIGGFTLYKLQRPIPGKGRLILIIAMGGVSTAIWGMLFGGWFGLEIGAGTFLDKLTWFKPLDEPMLMLGLSLGLGFVHILVGMGCNAYNLIRKKRVGDAVFEIFTWYFAFIGIGILVLNMLLWKLDALKIVALVFIVVGLGGLVLGNARGKKGVGGKIMGALGGVGKLYNGVNLLSDVLSYSRLFGLGLAGGVVAMVINKICGVIITLLPSIFGLPILGIIVCIPIFAVGHLFNIGISTLGAYIHDCRLQYIEFFGKFYNGSGHLFNPLGSNTKYTYIENAVVPKEETVKV